MSAANPVAGPGSEIGRLLQDLVDAKSVQFRVDAGDGLFIVWLTRRVTSQAGCHADTWWTLGTDDWHLMAQFAAVKRLCFVREPDRHTPEREVLFIRFVGSSGAPALRADFTPLYD